MTATPHDHREAFLNRRKAMSAFRAMFNGTWRIGGRDCFGCSGDGVTYRRLVLFGHHDVREMRLRDVCDLCGGVGRQPRNTDGSFVPSVLGAIA